MMASYQKLSIQCISERERGLSSKVWDCINIMQT